MQYAQQLAERIEERWRKADRNVDAFPEIAQEALAENPPEKHLHYQDIVDWVLTTNWFPVQIDMGERFGQPPVTLFANGHFEIDAYFWLDGSTAIHEHAFCGAFYVMHGSSVHTQFRFHPRHVHNHRLITGKLDVEEIEVLQVGDCRPIIAGHECIHALYHLDRPSVTIVVRTAVPNANPQLSYDWPCLAHANENYSPPVERRRRQMLTMMRKIEHPDYLTRLREVLLTSDPFDMFLTLDAHRTYFRDKIPQLRELLATLQAERGELIDRLVEVFRHDSRSRGIYQLRYAVHNSEHRFFLALLLNAHCRQDILKLTAQRYPKQDPVELILKWVRELNETEIDDRRSLNALGMKLNEMSLPVIRRALQHPTSAPLEAFQAEQNVGEMGGAVELEIRRIRDTSVLAKLLAV